MMSGNPDPVLRVGGHSDEMNDFSSKIERLEVGEKIEYFDKAPGDKKILKDLMSALEKGFNNTLGRNGRIFKVFAKSGSIFIEREN